MQFHENIKNCNICVDKNTDNKVMEKQYYISERIVSVSQT